jgi:hypothetical protein
VNIETRTILLRHNQDFCVESGFCLLNNYGRFLGPQEQFQGSESRGRREQHVEHAQARQLQAAPVGLHDARAAQDLGSGRIVVSEIEAPSMLAILV